MWPRLSFIVLFILSSEVCAKFGGGRHSSSGSGHSSSGSGHHYPASSGYSGTGSGGAHSYPHSSDLSGNSYNPSRNTYNSAHGASQNVPHGAHYGYKTEVHHHYNYSPPQHINYGSGTHPVYHEKPPVYVYEYRDSGSRFDNLLTGLALYNLGRMSAHHHDHYYDSHREYRSNPGEICKLGINKDNGEYEETRIDCKLISSFIWEAEKERNTLSTNKTTVTTTTVNVTQTISNGTGSRNSTNGNNTSISTTIIQNTTVVDALQAKGPSINVTPKMSCFMIRISRDSSVLKRKVECGLLQAYATNSLHYNASHRCISCVCPVAISLMFVNFINRTFL